MRLRKELWQKIHTSEITMSQKSDTLRVRIVFDFSMGLW